jgi:hypothetical protein
VVSVRQSITDCNSLIPSSALIYSSVNLSLALSPQPA